MPNRCHRCWLLLEVCLCELVVPVPTDVRFTIIRHVRERTKTTNTARIAAMALPSCELIDYGGRGNVFDETPHLGEGSWLLFPSDSNRAPPPGEVRNVIVLDGTWAQARGMLKRLPRICALPRLGVRPLDVDAERLRRPPFPGGMSTLEAMAEAVALLEGSERAAALRKLHADMVDRVLIGRGTKPGATRRVQNGDRLLFRAG
jgi:DTW domain-containing protein YfiP